ncbi:polyprenyl synthetase family protein [Saccharopolyspora sp. NPDC002578]
MITYTEPDRADFATEYEAVPRRIAGHVHEFVRERCIRDLSDLPDAKFVADLFSDFLAGGKYLRSTFNYLGWRSSAPESESALRAAGSLELLHAFALMQDDVMDDSIERRGTPSLHVRFAAWHRGQGLSGSSERFGASAAIVLGDLSLVWAEHMLRTSGLDTIALDRAWPCYDHMRSELAVGQLADLVNDARRVPRFEEVLAIARRKSGNYTVRNPLVLGALLGGARPAVLDVFRSYGSLIGEAFQLRDDLFGIFGNPAVTGKTTGDDLRNRKATSVVVLAHEIAPKRIRSQMDELFAATELDASDIERWQELIRATPVRERIEELIVYRATEALRVLAAAEISEPIRNTLSNMAIRCTARDR